jgi:15-cis-phytoene synthase
MADRLKLSTIYCRRVTRARARNFYYGFLLLPKPRRDAFCAVYAFMRYCDDVADGADTPPVKATLLREWKEALRRALAGDYGDSLILPAFHAAVQRYGIPSEYFYELIAGAEMDLDSRSYRTFSDLYQYCYRVASVVGLCSVQILGFRDAAARPAALKLAEECGIAFQLTNILRDLREDAQSGRIYLPLEDLERFEYSADQLRAGVYNPQFLNLMRFEIERARSYYDRADSLIDMIEPESRPALWTLISIYRGILSRIESSGADVFSHEAALSRREKIEVLLQAAARQLRQKAGLEPGWQRFRASG